MQNLLINFCSVVVVLTWDSDMTFGPSCLTCYLSVGFIVSYGRRAYILNPSTSKFDFLKNEGV